MTLNISIKLFKSYDLSLMPEIYVQALGLMPKA
jgi:hypothetical protein